MKTKTIIVVVITALLLAVVWITRPYLPDYPESATVDVVDNYFGVEVPDPFRWLEDHKSDKAREWIEAQNNVTFAYLERIPFREDIRNRLTEIWNFERYTAPFWENGRYFFYKNDGLQNQSVLFVREGLEGEPRALLNPNLIAEDGTAALAAVGISNDARYLAYSIAQGGSDWNEIFVRNIDTGEDLDVRIPWVKFSGIAWRGNGFYYSRFDAPAPGQELLAVNENHRVYFHQLGTPPHTDRLVHSNPAHPRRTYRAFTTDDERFLLISEAETTFGNAVLFKDYSKPAAKLTYLIEGFDHDNRVVDHIDGKFLVLTNNNAPMYRLVKIDPANPSPENWKEVIPESGYLLRGVSLIYNKLFAHYFENVMSKVYFHTLEGERIGELELPGIGTLGAFSGKRDEPGAFFTFSSFTFPTTVFQYNAATNTHEVYFAPEVDFDPNAFETRQVFFPSKDGTMIPMFITHKKGLRMDGRNPTLLYGYGGFNISRPPRFDVSRLILLENGGVFAVANIRGGGEFGQEWYKAGTRLNKQNVFDDFIAAAEYLIAENYTSPRRLAIQGVSNGGLLVGAVTNQRPDLFGVAFPDVGVMDMLRFHLFTIGWAWVTDYGSSENEEDFHNLLAYSPLHNIQDGVRYPAVFVTTADHDDRVVPGHSFKYIAELQRSKVGNNPALIRIETRAGHGAGKPVSMVIEELTDIYSFMFYNMGIRPRY
ncbi:MAG TPA: prolyl oligopeptidase family serine peptidase [Bacteroidales bacterium]|nr:prolyl oligopeptidase family serine peptidase [Bacteroidales bacterium]